VRIRVESQGSAPYSFFTANGERLLHAGLAQGLELPYECGTGTCGLCRAVLEEGTVSDLWSDAPGNKYKRRERNEILMCQSAACSDCVLRLPAAPVPSANPHPPTYVQGRIRGTEILSPGVLRLRLELERPLRVLPGHFVLIEAPGIDGPRAYSLTTSQRAKQLDLLIRRKIGGLLTEWLFSAGCIGQTIKLFGPMGKAVFRIDTDKDLLLAAGGTGVASTVAILDAATKAGHFESHKAHIFFGVRTPGDVFYLDELRGFADGVPRGAITINVCFSDSPAHSTAPVGLQFRDGFVHEIVKKDLPDINPGLTTALLYGPPPMIDAMLATLIKAKFSARQIRYDKFR
jgi:toluene monooxygenase electron transfer component